MSKGQISKCLSIEYNPRPKTCPRPYQNIVNPVGSLKHRILSKNIRTRHNSNFEKTVYSTAYKHFNLNVGIIRKQN